MAQYPDAQPSIPRATDSDYSDDPVVGFPALTDRLADEVEAITSELGTDPSGASATVKARIEAVESGKVSTSDARLSDARTPTAHASSHGSAGSDPITVAQSQVTNLTTDLGSLDTRLDTIETNANPIYVLVRNATGATLPKGTVVYTSGANGDNVQVSKARANSDATSARTLGFTTTDVANGSDGYVIVEGYLTGLDTSATTVGQIVYLSASTAGAWVTTKPVAPEHMVYLGVITRVNSTNGSIYVKVQNGYELDEIHDVLITSKANGDLLQYDSVTGLWKNLPQSSLVVSESQVTNLVTDLAGKVSTSDSRLTDSRTPTAHKTSHATGGTDALSPSDIGAATSGHTHAAYAATSHTHAETDVTSLVTDLAAKVDKSTVTAKADLIVGTGSGAVANLGVGANGQVLTADSTVSPTGLKWASAASGGYSTVKQYQQLVQAVSRQSSGTTKTLSFTSAHGLSAGDTIIVFAAGGTGYDGTFTVATVPNSTTITYTGSVSSTEGLVSTTRPYVVKVASLTQRSTMRMLGVTSTASDDSTNAETVLTNGAAGAPAINSYLTAYTYGFQSASFTDFQTLKLFPIYVGSPMTFDQVATRITTPAGVTSTARFGVYSNSAISGPIPAYLISDWGTASLIANTTNFNYTVSISWTVTVPGWYWLGVAFQGQTGPTINEAFGLPFDNTAGSVPTAAFVRSYQVTSVTGALPSAPSFGTPTNSDRLPIVVLRRSA